MSLGAVNICPSPRAGQLWRLQLTDRPGARKGVKGLKFAGLVCRHERRSRGGEVGRTEQTQVLPWANMLPSLPGHLQQAARVAAAGSTPLSRKQKYPAVENVAHLLPCPQANQRFSIGGNVVPWRVLGNIWRHFGLLEFGVKATGTV